MPGRWRFTSCAALLLAAACGRAATVRDPIEGIDVSRQRTISRADLGFRWPLSVGVGTLACDDAGTVLFRSQGILYVLRGQRVGTQNVEALRVSAPTPPPSNPLSRLRQAEREEAFRQMSRCDSNQADPAGCRRAVLQRLALSGAEWDQIDVEGHERRWPPLSRQPMSLEPLITAGQALCHPGGAR